MVFDHDLEIEARADQSLLVAQISLDTLNHRLKIRRFAAPPFHLGQGRSSRLELVPLQ